mgnify:CR=1 FL=1
MAAGLEALEEQRLETGARCVEGGGALGDRGVAHLQARSVGWHFLTKILPPFDHEILGVWFDMTLLVPTKTRNPSRSFR